MGYVFVAGKLLGQGNRIDINSNQQIIDMTNKDFQNQVFRGQYQHEGNLTVVLLLLRGCNPAKELQLLQKKKKWAWLKIEIQKLRKKKKQGFTLENEDLTGHLHNVVSHYQVMVEKACQVPDLTPYIKTLQQIFNIYVKEVAYTFATQLTIYLSEKLKYKYTGWFLKGISLDNWDNYQRCIKAIKVSK